jgi:hypothetical protein
MWTSFTQKMGEIDGLKAGIILIVYLAILVTFTIVSL